MRPIARVYTPAAIAAAVAGEISFNGEAACADNVCTDARIGEASLDDRPLPPRSSCDDDAEDALAGASLPQSVRLAYDDYAALLAAKPALADELEDLFAAELTRQGLSYDGSPWDVHAFPLLLDRDGHERITRVRVALLDAVHMRAADPRRHHVDRTTLLGEGLEVSLAGTLPAVALLHVLLEQRAAELAQARTALAQVDAAARTAACSQAVQRWVPTRTNPYFRPFTPQLRYSGRSSSSWRS